MLKSRLSALAGLLAAGAFLPGFGRPAVPTQPHHAAQPRFTGQPYPFSSTRQDERQRRQHARNTAKLAKREQSVVMRAWSVEVQKLAPYQSNGRTLVATVNPKKD